MYSVKICYGVEYSKRLKRLVTRGYLIKTPARRQGVNREVHRLQQKCVSVMELASYYWLGLKNLEVAARFLENYGFLV